MLIDYRRHLFGAGEPPEFPVEVLPYPIAEYVSRVADAFDVDPAMPGAWALGVVSAAVSGRLKTKPREAWIEHGPVWPCVVAEPGERKTPVLRMLRRPLDTSEATIIADAMRGRDVAESKAKAIEKAVAKAERALGDAHGDGDPATIEAADAALTALVEQARSLRLPPVPKMIGDDATSAKLHDLLADHGGRFAVFSVEGDTLYRRLASGDGDFQGPYLAGHGGDTLRRALVSRHVSDVDDPALTVVMAVQPGVLRNRGSSDELTSTGFRDRFLFALPASVLDIEPTDTSCVDAFLEAKYAGVISGIVERFWHLDEPRVLSYTAEARELFELFETRQREMLIVRRDDEPTMGSAKKLVGTVSRIAGLLAVLRDRDTLEVEVGDLHAAMALGEYFAGVSRHLFGHTMTAWGEVSADLDAVVRFYARRQARGQTPEAVAPRLVQKDLNRMRNRPAQDTAVALKRLWGVGWIEEVAGPSVTYKAHPELLESARKYGIV